MTDPISHHHPLAGIEDLREKREELNRSILRDEEEKAKIQKVRVFVLELVANLWGRAGGSRKTPFRCR
jgi:hypothetical protein